MRCWLRIRNRHTRARIAYVNRRVFGFKIRFDDESKIYLHVDMDFFDRPSVSYVVANCAVHKKHFRKMMRMRFAEAYWYGRKMAKDYGGTFFVELYNGVV